METAAAHREQLLRDFLEYRRSAVADGERTAPHDYVLVPGRDPSRARRLAELLVLQGIEVRQTTEPLAVTPAKTIAAGAFLVSAAQPVRTPGAQPARSARAAAGVVRERAGSPPPQPDE